MKGRGRSVGRSLVQSSGGSTPIPPVPNNAIVIDGSSMGFTITSPLDTNESAEAAFGLTEGAGLPTNLTMGLWVKPQAGMVYDTWSYFMTLDRNSPWDQYLAIGMNANGADRYKTFFDLGGAAAHGAGNLAIDTWSHVCLRKTGHVYNIIVNGLALVLDANDGPGLETQKTLSNAKDALRKIWINQVGASGQDPGLVFDGSLCSAFYISESLSLPQIVAIMASTDPVSGAEVSCRFDGHTDLDNLGTNEVAPISFGTLTTDTEGPYES